MHFGHHTILGVRINDLSPTDLIDYISTYVAANRRAWVFRALLNRADLVFCDGFGVRLAAALLGKPLHHRLTPPDWFPDLCARFAAKGHTLYLLGSCPGITEQVANRLTAASPSLRIVGCGHGYFDKILGSPENQAVVDAINAASPDLLVVGFGMPAQERWIAENWPHLNTRVALPVGAMFDYLAGVTPRAPRWLTDHGLEWLGRLLIEPRRLWRRYILGNPLFLYRVLRQKFSRSPTDLYS
jgi:N-acetylglucosaminyldiphosphoundecaprenol N-acetyl-beta-D-mannosaminyltransferase